MTPSRWWVLRSPSGKFLPESLSIWNDMPWGSLPSQHYPRAHWVEDPILATAVQLLEAREQIERAQRRGWSVVRARVVEDTE